MEKSSSPELIPTIFAVTVESIEPLCCGEYTVTTVLHFRCADEEQARAKALAYVEKNNITFTYPSIVDISQAKGLPDDILP